MKMIGPMREMMIKRVIQQAYNEVTGGYDNALMDGHIEEMPNRLQMEDEVYELVLGTKAIETPNGCQSVERDIRFLGAAKIRVMIKRYFAKQGEY